MSPWRCRRGGRIISDVANEPGAAFAELVGIVLIALGAVFVVGAMKRFPSVASETASSLTEIVIVAIVGGVLLWAGISVLMDPPQWLTTN